MTDPAEQFALVPLPPPGAERDRLTSGALMVGDMSACTEPILSSLAREAAEQLLSDTTEAIEQEHRLTAQRQRAEAQARAGALQTLVDGISRMAKRLDSLEQKRRDEAREARRRERVAIEASLPDPDNPDAPAFPTVGAGPGADTAKPPNVAPGFGPEHVAGEGPSDYSEDADAATGVLPTALEKGGPPEIGDYPAYDLEDLTHPQKPIPQTPTSIGGP
jgi:hypothetical protein